MSVATSAPQARDDVRDLARGLFDGRRAARRALAAEWDDRTAAERDEFAHLFTNALERTWLAMVKARLPRDRPPEIRIVDEQIGDGDAALVRTRIRTRDDDHLPLEYVMSGAGGTWRIHDVVIDDVSLVDNFRAQFARIGRTSSYAEIASRLRALEDADVAGPLVVAYFDTDRADLGPAAQRDLSRVAARFVTDRQARALVESHADQRGDVRSNYRLARRRADAIRRHLVSLGVADDRIVTVVYGDQQPLCRERLEACWERNRRAVVRLAP